MMYSVLGVTGQVGAATARALLAQNQGVRAVLRKPAAAHAWTSQGAGAAIADLTDTDALTEAFAGVDGVFVTTPPYLDVPDPFAENGAAIGRLRIALLAAGVKHLVYLSSIGAQHAHGLGAIGKLHDIEQAFGPLPIPSVAIRAGWFIDNYKGQIGTARESGKLSSMLAPLDLAVPMIATADIGKAAAELLRRGPSGTHVVELANRQPYSATDVARALGAILGRTVEASSIPRGQRAGVYRSWGLSSGAADAMSDMIDGFNSGWIAFEGGTIERMYGVTSLEAALEVLAPANL